jgi:sulfur carrier protein ThiS
MAGLYPFRRRGCPGYLHEFGLTPGHSTHYNLRMDTPPPTALLEYRGKTISTNAGQTLRDALRKANLIPDSVLAVRQGELITDDAILRAGDQIRLVAVISGG